MTDTIVAHDLVKTYGDVTALGGLSLRVPKGSVLCLLGPNGAGKTTAVRILSTLLRPDSGSASVAGPPGTASTTAACTTTTAHNLGPNPADPRAEGSASDEAHD